MAGRPALFFQGYDAGLRAHRPAPRARREAQINDLVQRLIDYRSTYCRGYLCALVQRGCIAYDLPEMVIEHLRLANPHWKAGYIVPAYARHWDG